MEPSLVGCWRFCATDCREEIDEQSAQDSDRGIEGFEVSPCVSIGTHVSTVTLCFTISVVKNLPSKTILTQIASNHC